MPTAAPDPALPPPLGGTPTGRWPHVARALSARNYRVFFAGQSVSLIGNWMTSTAMAWVAYDLTRDPLVLGFVAFMNQIPMFLLAPFAGVWADRVDRLRMLFLTQIVALVPSVVLAVVAWFGAMDVTTLVLCGLAKGLVNAFDLPLRHAMTVEFVGDRRLLQNAIALNSSMFNVARIVGPSVAGAVILVGGPALCFGLDVLTYAFVLASIASLRLPARRHDGPRVHAAAALREGLEYAWRLPPLRTVLLFAPTISLMGFTPGVLAPLFAREFYDGTALTQGMLTSGFGIGALASALFLGSRHSPEGLGRVVATGALLLGAGLTCFAWIHVFPLAVAAFACAGSGAILAMAGSNTLLQSMVDDDKRGRVMGLFSMCQGMFPLGALLMGALAGWLGAPAAVQVAACCVLLSGLFFLRQLRPWERAAHALMRRP